MVKEFLKGLATLGLAGAVGAIYFSPTAVAIYMNSKFKDIGEGYTVREIDNQSQFYSGTNGGAGRLCIDENMDGTLDKVLVNMPVGPYMGGPGYRLMKPKTTATDREKFERANYLLSQEKLKGG